MLFSVFLRIFDVVFVVPSMSKPGETDEVEPNGDSVPESLPDDDCKDESSEINPLIIPLLS